MTEHRSFRYKLFGYMYTAIIARASAPLIQRQRDVHQTTNRNSHLEYLGLIFLDYIRAPPD